MGSEIRSTICPYQGKRPWSYSKQLRQTNSWSIQENTSSNHRKRSHDPPNRYLPRATSNPMGIRYNPKPGHRGNRTGKRRSLGGCDKAPEKIARQTKSSERRKAPDNHNSPPRGGKTNPRPADEKTGGDRAYNEEEITNEHLRERD
ncbi:hypothetical protein K402DRAFT_397391 [Aulographum hederae CBS 113979]|uniref:Uncharacterized protein n=1 Tax=Aulographum hederae CBS 113979 TaxID=1176131 RepID=A0A6G1GPL2_9PEZI|nr:hypothetical protein K402DRAFT_397391 [Aulographum hederae CBS 113979]